MERIRVDRQRNEVLLSFNQDIYDDAKVEQAMEDFRGACEVYRGKGSVLLRPKEELDIDLLGHEFYNYVLGLMKNS